MKKAMIEYEEGSGNVFADLGLEDAEQLRARSLLGYHVIKLLEEQNLQQPEIGVRLNLNQAEVQNLLNGHYSDFSIEKLFDFLNRLDRKVTIQISSHCQGEPYQCVNLV
jgi:predicted XRE-type DNA-binding protein